MARTVSGAPPRSAHGAPPRRGPGGDQYLDLAELLSHAARRLRRDSVANLAPLGLTMAQARVLRIVSGAPVRMADIAARLDVVPRTVTPMVDGLEAAGLVQRRADPDDRRSVLVELSGAGRRLLAGLHSARRASAEQVFSALGPPERRQLAALLGRLCERGGCVSCRGEDGAS